MGNSILILYLRVDTCFSAEIHHSIYIEYISQVYTLNLVVLILNYDLVRIRYFLFSLFLMLCLLQIAFNHKKMLPKLPAARMREPESSDENEGLIPAETWAQGHLAFHALLAKSKRKRGCMTNLVVIKNLSNKENNVVLSNSLNTNHFHNQII